jgi:hypothetical protein
MFFDLSLISQILCILVPTCDNDTIVCEIHLHTCRFSNIYLLKHAQFSEHTPECDLYMQSVIFTRMAMISTRMSVTSSHMSVIKTRMSVITTRTSVINTRKV